MRETTPLQWQKASRSAASGNCVEVAALGDGRVAIRDSKDPDARPLVVSRAGMRTWLAGIKAGALGR